MLRNLKWAEECALISFRLQLNYSFCHLLLWRCDQRYEQSLEFSLTHHGESFNCASLSIRKMVPEIDKNGKIDLKHHYG